LGAVFVVVAEKFSRSADAIFGERLFSVQAVASSLGLSIFSAAIYSFYVYVFGPKLPQAMGYYVRVAVLSVVIGSLGVFVTFFRFIFPAWRSLHLPLALMSMIPALLVTSFGFALIFYPFFLDMVSTVSMVSMRWFLVEIFALNVSAYILSFISDVCFIAVTRKMLRTIISVRTTGKVVALLGVNLRARVCINWGSSYFCLWWVLRGGNNPLGGPI
jgi:hypothetical protein